MLVVADKLSDKVIAQQIGIAERTMEGWKRKPAFVARMEQMRRAVRRGLNEIGIAEKPTG